MNAYDTWDLELPIELADVSVNIVHTDDAAIVTATAVIGGSVFQANASSKRDERDRPNAEIGIKLAAGRAIRSLGRQVLRDANALVRLQELNRQSQVKAKEEAKLKREQRAAAIKSGLASTPAKKTAAKKAAKKTASK